MWSIVGTCYVYEGPTLFEGLPCPTMPRSASPAALVVFHASHSFKLPLKHLLVACLWTLNVPPSLFPFCLRAVCLYTHIHWICIETQIQGRLIYCCTRLGNNDIFFSIFVMGYSQVVTKIILHKKLTDLKVKCRGYRCTYYFKECIRSTFFTAHQAAPLTFFFISR